MYTCVSENPGNPGDSRESQKSRKVWEFAHGVHGRAQHTLMAQENISGKDNMTLGICLCTVTLVLREMGFQPPPFIPTRRGGAVGGWRKDSYTPRGAISPPFFISRERAFCVQELQNFNNMHIYTYY